MSFCGVKIAHQRGLSWRPVDLTSFELGLFPFKTGSHRKAGLIVVFINIVTTCGHLFLKCYFEHVKSTRHLNIIGQEDHLTISMSHHRDYLKEMVVDK